MAQVRLGKLKKMWQNQQKGGQNSVRSCNDMKKKDRHQVDKWLWLIYWKAVRFPLYNCDTDFAIHHNMDMFQIFQIVLGIRLIEPQE